MIQECKGTPERGQAVSKIVEALERAEAAVPMGRENVECNKAREEVLMLERC